VCCMVGAQQKPFKGGSAPMKESQWQVMAWVAAELCAFYGIAVTKETVLGHGEVQKTLGIAQNGKWDPMALPWDTSKSVAQVGDAFRDAVTSGLAVIGFLRAISILVR
jgi:N-acetyl-anhydromuramyl-L-alanine amidase AmpD